MILIKVILGVGLLLSLSLPLHATTHLSQAQAIQSASDFCQKIGASVSVPGTAQFPVPSPFPWAWIHWQSAWQITFPGQANVKVLDADGAIIDYDNLALDKKWEGQPAGEAITQEEAIRKATTVLRATGITDELLFAGTALNQSNENNPLASTHTWGIGWQRQLHGISYKNNRFTVHLQAETGELQSLEAAFPAPPPQITLVRVTQEQADSIAGSMVARAGLQNSVLNDAKIEIVQPNTYWQPGGNEEEIPGVSRVAYTYYFSVDGEKFYELYVDANTSDVIGGSYGELMGIGQSIPQLPLSKALAATEEVRVYHQEAKGGWSKKPIAVLNNTTQSKMLTLFKATKPAKNAGPLALAEYKFVLTARGKPLCELRYLPKTGRVGMGRAWGIVPDRFKTWMQTLAPSAKTAVAGVKIPKAVAKHTP